MKYVILLGALITTPVVAHTVDRAIYLQDKYLAVNAANITNTAKSPCVIKIANGRYSIFGCHVR